MTGSFDLLCNLREYSGTQNIQIANGSNLPIIAIGDVGPSFPCVFVSPGLSVNLISVGQMVDNNWDMHHDYHNLHIFGCVCFVHLPSHERHKLTAQSARCAFMGYSAGQKGFLCYDAVTNRLSMSRNVIFFEHEYYFQQHVSCSNGVMLPTFDDISPPVLWY